MANDRPGLDACFHIVIILVGERLVGPVSELGCDLVTSVKKFEEGLESLLEIVKLGPFALLLTEGFFTFIELLDLVFG